MRKHRMRNQITKQLEDIPFTPEEEAIADAEAAAWVAGETGRLALAEIDRLEATMTPRRLREAILTPEGASWLTNIEANILIERSKL